MTEIEKTIAKITGSRQRPFDIFGPLASEDDLGKSFRSLSRIIHPDQFTSDPKLREKAEDAMGLLTQLRIEARVQIKDKTYGKAPRPKGAVIKSKFVYEDVQPLASGNISDIYTAEFTEDGKRKRATVKVLRDPGDADLLMNEANQLKALSASKDKDRDFFIKAIPRLIESANLKIEGKNQRANILSRSRGTYTMSEVMGAYPGGIDPRDAAWMWRRMLETMHWVHKVGHFHGAILPCHVLIRPEDHAGRLIDWSYGAKISDDLDCRVKAIVPEYEDFYPPETTKKIPHTGAFDVYMAGKCMIALLGAPRSSLTPDRLRSEVPQAIRGVLKACILGSPNARYPDMTHVYRDFDEALRTTYGPKKFREFHMPPKN
jgi:hypothetical protein